VKGQTIEDQTNRPFKFAIMFFCGKIHKNRYVFFRRYESPPKILSALGMEVIELTRKSLFIVLSLAAVLLAIPYIGMAHAKPFTTVSGTIMLTSVAPLEGRPAGKSDNIIFLFDITEEWSGDIAGTGTTESTWVTHNWVAPMGGPDTWFNVYEKLILDATVLGEMGTLTMELIIVGTEGRWTILGGTGGLANLHGHGTATLTTTPYSYTGQVHFDP
jgi:hypothetical protein